MKSIDDSFVAVDDIALIKASEQIDRIVADIDLKLNTVNNLISNTKYCWNDNCADFMREDCHFDKETAEEIIKGFKLRKNTLNSIADNYRTVEKKNAESIESLPDTVLE